MDEDLNFLINALAVPDSPLTMAYSSTQLQEMRESFITLQELLRHNPMACESGAPGKAGGDTINERLLCGLVEELSPVRAMIDHQFQASGQSVPRSWTSLGSNYLKQVCCCTSMSRSSCSTRHSSTQTPSNSWSISANDGEGDSELFYDASDEFLEILPDCSSSEDCLDLVPYVGTEPESESESESEPDTEVEGSLSEQSLITVTKNSKSSVSICLPLPLRYVCNTSFELVRSDSEVTLKPDGSNYTLH
ncbi:uncharacterized protein LOC115630639 [Scaptodrosophila lebanonensis]|uniref:Uncharacterized protein LOC115630639 n=1 Tax=Drosophila lebanonensis TaxID=7225 RepID=A0A6J2U428_DROLE|nr:uncharacterized protein LOC115630639 [Scaptodrosophila lebanonensis]